MADRIHDRFLWLGFGLFLFVAAKAVNHALSDIVRSIRTDDEDTEPPNSAQTEAAISVDTLRTLVASPNPSIFQAAASITISRFAQLPDAFRIVSEDMCSPDPVLSRRARYAYEMLLPYARAADRARPAMPPLPPLVELEAEPVLPWGLTRAWSRHSFADASERAWSDGDSASIRGTGIVPSIENPVAGWTHVPREQPDAQEMQVRRRRREAMLLHEGDGSVVESDIIRPREG